MKKKIAYIISRFPTVSETFILYEMLELKKLGMEIYVFPLIHQKGAVVHAEVQSIDPYVHYPKLLSLSTIRDHFYWFTKRPFVYVQTGMKVLIKNIRSPKFFSRAVVVLLQSAHTARQINELGVQHMHAHSATHPTLMAYIIQRLTDIPYSFTAHSSDFYFNQTMLDEKIRRASFVVTISNYNVNFLQGVAPSAAITPVHVVHCGIDSAKFKVDTEKQRGELFKIICVGRLETIKGHQYLIEACAQLKAEDINFRCYLIGDGELSSRIQQEINRLGLASYIEMLGFQTHDKVAALLNEVDLLVLPSLSEGIPVAVMEGMAAGLPIVATAVTGVPELVENGVTGILVPSKDSAALAEAIRTLSLSPELRIQMGQAGRKKVLNEFSLQKSASELYNVLANS